MCVCVCVCVCVYLYINQGLLVNKVNIAKEDGNREHCLHKHYVQENQSQSLLLYREDCKIIYPDRYARNILFTP